jgi:hypothetical protein
MPWAIAALSISGSIDGAAAAGLPVGNGLLFLFDG